MRKCTHSMLFIFLVTLAVTSCGKRPSYVLPKDKMIDVLYDVQLAQAITDGAIPNFESLESKERLMKSVYEKHNITGVMLDSSLMWYSDNIKLYNEINDSVVSKLAKTQTELRDAEFRLRGGGQNSKEILPTHFYLNENKYLHTFLLDSSRIKADNITDFQLQFSIQGLNPQMQNVETGVYYKYKDTLIQNILYISEDSFYIIKKPSLPDSLLTQIRGYIRLRGDKESNPVLMYNVKYQQPQDTVSNKATEIAGKLDRDNLE